jgi:TolA-binding protein
MREGSVIVSDAPGTNGPERLRAGQTLRAWGRRGAFEIVETPSTTAAASLAGASAVLAPASPASAPSLAPAPPERAARAHAREEGAPSSLASFRELAAKARYVDALHAAERVGFDSACETLGSDDVVLLGDVARLAGATARAEVAYRAARRRFPSADRAAFALGVTEFDQRRRYDEAASWFETYLRQYPSGSFAREAAGRLIEARQRAGDATRAREAARAYLARYPTGPHATLAHQILGS